MESSLSRRLKWICMPGAGTLLASGAAAIAAGQQNAVPATGKLAITTSNVKLRPCATGFDATAKAVIRVSSRDSRLAGIMRLNLQETASTADNAVVTAAGGFFDPRNGARKGTVTLTAIDKGNNLDGLYVIRLTNGRGTIYANTSSHQDSGSRAHGEIGGNTPVAPTNSAVIVTGHC